MSTSKRTRTHRRHNAAMVPSPDTVAGGASTLVPTVHDQAANGPMRPRTDMQRAMEQPRGSIESVASSEPQSGVANFSEAPDDVDGAGMPPHLRE